MITAARRRRFELPPTQVRVPIHDSAFDPKAKVAKARLAVITCYFNFAGYKRPQNNMLRFLRQMDARNIPVYGVELVKEGQQSLMQGNPNWRIIQGSRRSIMWQKEVLLNQAAGLVPSHIGAIAAIDSDVTFANPDWVDESVYALRKHKVIQPFAAAIWTDEQGIPDMTRHSCGRSGLDENWNGHPGFAWAMRRDFFVHGGFYPYALLGAGDTVTACGLLGIDLFAASNAAIGRPNLENGVFDKWRKDIRAYMGDTELGYIDGDLWHEWHGSRKDRKYAQRAKFIENMDVLRDVRMNSAGFLEWTPEADNQMILDVCDYFKGRFEDGTAE